MIRPAAAVVALLSAALASPGLAKTCTSAADIQAMQYRQFQIELMVATLKCDPYYPGFRPKYTAYMQKVGPAMTQNANQLKSMFQRQGKGAAYLDRYLTQLSNDAQIRSQGQENYCERYEAALDRVSTMRSTEIPAFAASSVGMPYGASACAATKQASAKSAAKDRTQAKPRTKKQEG